MHNRPIVKMLSPPITLRAHAFLSGHWFVAYRRRRKFAEMPHDGREIARLRCHSATLLQQNPHGVADLFLGMSRRQKEAQPRGPFRVPQGRGSAGR